MIKLDSPQIVQETVLRWKRESRIALVPTMGALHEGHLELVKLAKKFGDRVVASIFVNPLQFGPKEDLSKYPRTPEADAEKLESLGVDLLFTPEPADLYPGGFQTRVQTGTLAAHLCGKSRPGHFEGVATVCLKLFQTTQADFAVFGEKDFQQLRVIQQMSADFNMPLTILPHPIVREEDGLALSSRNRYLSSEDRARAAKFPAALAKAQARAKANGAETIASLLGAVESDLKSAGIEIDYLAVCSETDLVPAEGAVASLSQPRLFGAVKIGSTRLIDNWKLYSDTHETPA